MRIIKYYDRIHKEYIDLEVTDEVAKFLFANDKWLRRKQVEYDYSTIPLDSPIYSNGEDEEITLAETLEDKTEIIDYEPSPKRKWLAKIVWKIIEKLKPEQQELIKDIFFYGKTQKEIAKSKGVTEGAISQLKATAMLHLTYHFYTDKEFMQSDIYQRNKLSFEDDLARVVKEIDKEKGLQFNLNAIKDLTKANTQLLKRASGLGIEIDDRQINLFNSMNKIVKEVLNNLDVDWNKENIITIPSNLKIPDELIPKHR